MLWRRLSRQCHHGRTKLRFDAPFSSMVTMDSHWEEFETLTMTKTKQNVSDSIAATWSSLTLSELVEQIPNSILQRKRGGIPAGCSKRDPVLQLMRRLNAEAISTELQKYFYYDPTISYTRNLIATDNENYTLLLLCWNKDNSESPIHNHPGDGCYMRVISGSIVETLYDVKQQQHQHHHHDVTESRATASTATTKLECTATNHYGTNQVAFINDTIGYHSIRSGILTEPFTTHSASFGASEPGAISLHLYCPPIKQCQIVVRSSSSNDDDHDDESHSSKARKASKVYVRDSGPMYHHTEYGQRSCTGNTVSTSKEL